MPFRAFGSWECSGSDVTVQQLAVTDDSLEPVMAN